MRIFWVSPMAPSSNVPTNPEMPSAGVTGAVVPTPDGCHPPKNCEMVDDQDGNGVNWPTAGRWLVITPRDPMTTSTAAVSQMARRVLPVTRPASVVPTPGSSSSPSSGPP